MFRCECCEREFPDPISQTLTENLDGENGWWTHTEQYCPYCGSEYFEEIEEEIA